MVREIVTIDWCDLCMRDGERERVEESHRLVIDGKSFNVDLCANHVGEFKAFVDLVTIASAQHSDPAMPGGKPAGGKASKHVRPCLLCGTQLTSTSGLATHVEREHGISPREMFGDTCPLCKAQHETPQGLGVHCRATHHDEYPLVVDTPTAFAVAEVNGDRLGIVARQRKRAVKGSEQALAARAAQAEREGREAVEEARQVLDGL